MQTPFGKILTPFGKILAVFFCPKAWDFSLELPRVKMQGSCRVHAGFKAKCTTSKVLKAKWLSIPSAELQSFCGNTEYPFLPGELSAIVPLKNGV
jgi:hypothetical protein